MSDSTAQPGRDSALQGIWQHATWLYEPASWEVKANGQLLVTAEPHSDFWRLTHNGEIHHNGHFFGQPVQGDFTAGVSVRGDYRSLYDQAGLMIYLDETNWIKMGVELVQDVPHASVVVTRNTSDWSLIPAPNREHMWFRVLRYGATIEVSISGDGATHGLFRQCTLTDSPVRVGPLCCSPGEGFTATFEDFTLTQR